MKTATKIIGIFALVSFVFGSHGLFAQQCSPDWTEPTVRTGSIIIYPDGKRLDVPETMKSRMDFSELNESNSKTGFMYMEELGWCANIVFDNQGKIVVIVVPGNSTIPTDYLVNRWDNPIKHCKDEEGYDIPCVVNTVVIAIVDWWESL